ncbi:MAG: hypothetical protein KGZ83_05765 [Sulfuricella sp.]|nr:hypothetical protein [Sulfuricella sp.]
MTAPIFPIAYYTLLEAVRNRMIWLVLVVVAASLGLGQFLHEIAITENAQIQSALLGAMLRFLAVFILAVFIITSMVRELNDKGSELILSLPIPRASYLAGKVLGFSGCALALAGIFAATLLIYAPPSQVALWGLSLFLELWIIEAFCLLCVFTFSQVVPALSATLAFYLLARSIAAFQLIAHGPLTPDESWSQQAINTIITAIAAVLPRLDTFTQTEWLAYHTGSWAALLPVATQSLIYVMLLGGAALFDLYRKNL